MATLAFFAKEFYRMHMLYFIKKYSVYVVYAFIVVTFCGAVFTVEDVFAASKEKKSSNWDALKAHDDAQDEFWKKSVSGQTFLQGKGLKKEVKDTGREAREKFKAENDKNNDGITFGKGVLTDKAGAVGKQVSPPSSIERSLDENFEHQTHDVYGAYKDVVRQKDLEVKMGPEVMVPATSTEALQKGETPKTSDVGVGMKLKWDF